MDDMIYTIVTSGNAEALKQVVEQYESVSKRKENEEDEGN